MARIEDLYIGATVRYVPTGALGVVAGFIGFADVRVMVGTAARVVAARDLDLIPVDPGEVIRQGKAATDARGVRDFLLRDRALQLRWAYQFDPVYGLSNARIELKPHQVSVAQRVLSKSKPRMVLSDEVGLGKTIEAGLILKELRARGVLERLLIIAPASLVSQWERELRSKFNEDCQVYDGAYIRRLVSQEPDRNPWTVHSTIVTSLALARRDEHIGNILSATWDMVVFDEAHHVRLKWEGGEEVAVKAYRMAEQLAPDVYGLLLLTATPMQLDPYEFYGLVSLVAPGLFSNYREFDRHRKEIKILNLLLRALEDFPMLPLGLDGSLEEHLTRVLGLPRDEVREETASKSGRARLAEAVQGRHLLSEVLIRNRKCVIGENTKRVPKMLAVDMTEAERSLYDDVSDYIKVVYGRAKGEGNVLLGFVMTTYRKILASSSYALSTAMGRRATKLELELEALRLAVRDAQQTTSNRDFLDDLRDFGEEDIEEELSDTLHELEDLAGGLTAEESIEALEAEIFLVRDLEQRAREVHDTKLECLKRAVRQLLSSNPQEKVLIFTQFVETQSYLAEQLQQLGTVALFNGRMSADEKDKQWRLFRDRANIMIATESGGEGRNFQFSHILVNYDLPWNPMKVEQRIGRLDRIGQTHEVHVYNFSIKDTIEDRVLQILQQRIQLFEETIGGLDPILGDIEQDITQLVFASPREVEVLAANLEEDVQRRIQGARRKERDLADFILDRRSFRQDETNELLGRTPEASYADLERFVSDFLARYLVDSQQDPFVKVEREGYFRVTTPQVLRRKGLEESYLGTFNPKHALRDEQIQFFAFGHTLVDKLVAEATADGVAPLAAHLEIVSADLGSFDGYRFLFQLRTEQPIPDSKLFELWIGEDGEIREDLCRLLWNAGVEYRTLPASHLSGEGIDARLDQALELAGSRREEARVEASERWETYVAEERRRGEKLRDFKLNKLRVELANREERLKRLQESDRPEDRRVLPAIEGLVRSTRERIRVAEDEYNDLLRDLSARERNVGADYELLSAAYVRLAGIKASG